MHRRYRFSDIRRLIARFFPPACAGCDGQAPAGESFCAVCAPVAHRLTRPCCAICRLPMEQFRCSEGPSSECSRCRRRRPSFCRLFAFWEYDGAVADAVRRIKYGGDIAALRALCRGVRSWFRHRLEDLPSSAPLVPVPSHPAELRRRGFHVPTLALRQLLDRRRRQRIHHRLRKLRKTPRQASLPLAARRKNVRGAFADRDSTSSTGPAILFDDVVTTGATANAAAAALADAGFDDVYVITLARAPSFRPR